MFILNYILKQHNDNKSQNNEVPIFKDLSRLLFKYLVCVQRKNWYFRITFNIAFHKKIDASLKIMKLFRREERK